MKETVKLQLAQTESVRKNPCMKSWWFEVKSAETLKISTNAKGKKRKTCLIASDWISANVSEAVCGGSCCCTERMCENISNKTTYVKQREGFPSSVCLCWFSQKAAINNSVVLLLHPCCVCVEYRNMRPSSWRVTGDCSDVGWWHWSHDICLLFCTWGPCSPEGGKKPTEMQIDVFHNPRT